MCSLSELKRVKNTNSTRRYLNEVIDVLSCMPPPLVLPGLEELVADNSLTPQMRAKVEFVRGDLAYRHQQRITIGAMVAVLRDGRMDRVVAKGRLGEPGIISARSCSMREKTVGKKERRAAAGGDFRPVAAGWQAEAQGVRSQAGRTAHGTGENAVLDQGRRARNSSCCSRAVTPLERAGPSSALPSR